MGISTVLRESTAGTSRNGTTGVQIRPAYRASDDTPDEAPRWIAPQLWHALFAQQGTGRVYALIEAARWMGADDDIAHALTQADVPGVCLFDLDEDSPLAPYAPWLIDVTLAHQDNRDPPSDIHRTLFATLANAGPMFGAMQSDATKSIEEGHEADPEDPEDMGYLQFTYFSNYWRSGEYSPTNRFVTLADKDENLHTPLINAGIAIDERRIRYVATGPNSNSFAMSLAERVGLPRPKPSGDAPGSGMSL